MKIRIPDDLQSLLVPLADIRLDPANANEHDDAGIQDIAMSIAEFGFDQPVLVRQDGQLIAGEVSRVTGSPDVAVIGRGEHLCMSMRGVKTPAIMTSSAMYGVFREKPEARAEFLALTT